MEEAEEGDKEARVSTATKALYAGTSRATNPGLLFRRRVTNVMDSHIPGSRRMNLRFSGSGGSQIERLGSGAIKTVLWGLNKFL